MKIYHYTSIKNLALILHYQTIRFNRLDRVDDLEETMYGSNNLIYELYTFASCWTKDSSENLALWKMYAGYEGVRICLDEDMFVSYDEPFKTYKTYYDRMIYFAKDCTIAQTSNPIKLCDVEYVDDPKKEKSDYVKENNGEIKIDTSRTGLIKRKEWQMQKESRFKIQTLPLNPKYLDGLSNDKLNSMNIEELTKANFTITPAIIKSINERYKIETPFIDIKLKKTALDNIEILMGPQTTMADRIIIDALLKSCKNSHVEDSIFKHLLSDKA